MDRDRYPVSSVMTYNRSALADLLTASTSAKDAEAENISAAIQTILAPLDFYRLHKEPMLRLAGSAADVRPPMLAFHLIRNARTGGVEHALIGLDELFALTSNDTLTAVYVDNVEADSTVELGDDVTAYPDDHAPNAHFAQAILETRPKIIQRRGAILIARQTQKPFHVLPKGVDLPRALAGMDTSLPGMDRLEKALKLITLDGPSAPVIRVAASYVTSPGVRLFAQPSGTSFLGGMAGYAPGMPVKITSKCAALLPCYKGLTEPHRRKIDGAITRLNRAVGSVEVADTIVETAISIEALLGGDGNTELTYRLKLRSALLLEDEPAKRKQISDIIGKLYAERSSIVHTGYAKKGDHPLAQQGISIAQRLIERVLGLGRIPDWHELELGGALTANG